jgi:hypothetical protein
MPSSKLASSSPPVADDPARAALETALEELGETAEQVSLAIEMPRAYLRSFLEHGVPRALPNRVRRRLATYLGIPDYALS